MNYVIPFLNVEDTDLSSVGGKGLSLGKLSRAGFPVPQGFVISTEAYKEFSGSKINEKLKGEILDQFDKLKAGRVAVRSSAVAEDSSDSSWAGQFESYLNVDRNNLITSVEKCWESVKTDAVKFYASLNSVSEDKLALAVVVQRMIDSEVSGVAFSVNPITKNQDEIIIEAVYGLGELLVQGLVTPDNYEVSKETGKINNLQIQLKSKKLVFRNGNNIEELVDKNKAHIPSLSELQVKNLTALIKKVEIYYGKPQDIEWAMDKTNEFFLIQSRPITTF